MNTCEAVIEIRGFVKRLESLLEKQHKTIKVTQKELDWQKNRIKRLLGGVQP